MPWTYLVILVAYIKISAATKNISNFFSVVNVLLKERLDFLFVTRQVIRMNCNNISVAVSTFITNSIKPGVD
jgi:hypothetical protein